MPRAERTTTVSMRIVSPPKLKRYTKDGKRLTEEVWTILRTLRYQAGFSQSKVAKATGIKSNSSISELERGLSGVCNSFTRQTIADLFKVPVSKLFDKDGFPKKDEYEGRARILMGIPIKLGSFKNAREAFEDAIRTTPGEPRNYSNGKSAPGNSSDKPVSTKFRKPFKSTLRQTNKRQLKKHPTLRWGILKTLRESERLTQRDVCDLIGNKAKDYQISGWERGLRPVPAELREPIASIFGKRVEEIFSSTGMVLFDPNRKVEDLFTEGYPSGHKPGRKYWGSKKREREEETAVETIAERKVENEVTETETEPSRDTRTLSAVKSMFLRFTSLSYQEQDAFLQLVEVWKKL